MTPRRRRRPAAGGRRGPVATAGPATTLESAPAGLAPGWALYLKREDGHELGAFKWRGALPTLEEYRARGHTTVVTASTGNHGAATAWAARRLGIRAVVFAPAGASRAKLALIAAQGAEVREIGRDFDAAKDLARAFAVDSGAPFFEDGAEPAQYRGYGTIAAEIVDQMDRAPAAVVVPIGNGALIGGIGLVLHDRSPATRVIGVAAKEAPVMALSHQAGRPVVCDRTATFADGLAVRVAIPYALTVLRRVVHRMLLVSEREIARAVGGYARAGIRVEGAAAAALAALAQLPPPGGPIVAIVTGRNIDDPVHLRAVNHPESFAE